MSRYRSNLPQCSDMSHGADKLFLTDGGIETSLIFHDGFDLPYFAAFILLDSPDGRAALDRYFRRYAAIAAESGHGFILESPTWRASSDWGALLGYDADALAAINTRAIAMLSEMRNGLDSVAAPFIVSGCVGPRGDGYDRGATMSIGQARDYHMPQIATFAEAGADMITAITMTNVEEATGLALAARDAQMPCAISFTVETDGRLPSSAPLGRAIMFVDQATGTHPAYYMINCAHPTHFEETVACGDRWVDRIRGVRANASTMSHAELDQSETLDDGDPADLGNRFRTLRDLMPNLNVLGGCCGTDHRHVEAICRACAEDRRAA